MSQYLSDPVDILKGAAGGGAAAGGAAAGGAAAGGAAAGGAAAGGAAAGGAAAGGAAAGGAAAGGADPVYEIDPRDPLKGDVEGGGFYLPAEAVAMIDSRNTGPSVLLLLAVGFGAYLLTLAINPSLPSFGGGRSSSRRPSGGSKPSWSR